MPKWFIVFWSAIVGSAVTAAAAATLTVGAASLIATAAIYYANKEDQEELQRNQVANAFQRQSVFDNQNAIHSSAAIGGRDPRSRQKDPLVDKT